ncbi:MAG: PIG-L family deacetylase [Anaerolineae bacterium]|nr:PIG-L family deacetylase [Thermoflexales bacterium]MDW8408286.1 PIG-L family deacetylase [Anaerolineae bacterium]
MSEARVAMAIAAHPDDIEFTMAGTLLLLKHASYDIHMWNLANGHCGTAVHDRAEIIRLRTAEAEASARLAGAVIHPPIADDLAIFYEAGLLAQVAAVIREVQPSILLIPSPQDYMEDHTNTCRLAVAAAFARGMRNFETRPPRPPWNGNTVLYHAMPHGLRDGLRRLVQPELYVDISSVLPLKREMLSQHRTQKDWLDLSQGMGSYVAAMEEMSRTVGRMSGRFEHAEGWRRHSNLGFAAPDANPLAQALGAQCWIDPTYERLLSLSANEE